MNNDLIFGIATLVIYFIMTIASLMIPCCSPLEFRNDSHKKAYFLL